MSWTVVTVGAVLPASPFGAMLGFRPLPGTFFLALVRAWRPVQPDREQRRRPSVGADRRRSTHHRLRR
jgi:hypothetical protein